MIRTFRTYQPLDKLKFRRQNWNENFGAGPLRLLNPNVPIRVDGSDSVAAVASVTARRHRPVEPTK